MLNSDIDLVGDCVLILELSVMTDDAFDDDVVEPVGESGPIVEDVGDNPPSEVSEAKLDDPFPFGVTPAASIGLLNGETARELNGDDDDDGEPLRRPPFRFVMLLIVFAMVCLAACLARSVDTKLLTSSFRLPFTSGAARRSRDFATSGFLSKLSPFVLVRDGKVADFDVINDGADRPDSVDGDADVGVEGGDVMTGPFVRVPLVLGIDWLC